ncbi:MAG: hypothetical protein COW24_02575 [Candidatus Kerfeldbacteria bacterium CG15_BIG_FIL_POST_REV_8_21_14_020_45_12]|uniref:Uncharacterized protein n=1 Tax=Candidatus Kerfeldbacteria bacterium CG15_BIG_FIL_POST_REV_8_21_14_020_45_12 TaxID=2014247 RepID=A0A2M7H426_9BACT|nr:MAG: hypothetical protein COW24_02575 [Candidatus Kerfeldbacteria bacterium CG15_BIG_FIL_POST_REV_8_21_14_020_45_12]PJA93883.1 MAG: hypothetical protein CO132_00840 [Candidatus Kerfeldbacteria bacterium CG_4_9_14_3_um_filter_45_8]
MPFRPGEFKPPRQRIVDSDLVADRVPREIPGARLDVVSNDGIDDESRDSAENRTVMLKDPTVAHLLSRVVEYQQQQERISAEREASESAADEGSTAAPVEVGPTPLEMLSDYQVSKQEIMNSVGEDFDIETDFDNAIKLRWSEAEIDRALDLLKGVQVDPVDDQAVALQVTIQQAVETLSAARLTAQEQWGRELQARRFDAGEQHRRQKREDRHGHRNDYLARTFGSIPPEYASLSSGDAISREGLSQHYDLVTPDSRSIIKGVSPESSVGMLVDLPENISTGQAETVVYHRFTPDELAMISQSSEANPVIIGLRQGGDSAIALTAYDLERGSARRIGEAEYKVFRQSNGTLTFDCVDPNSGFQLVLEKDGEQSTEETDDAETWDEEYSDDPALEQTAESRPAWQRWETMPLVSTDISSVEVSRPFERREAATLLGAALDSLGKDMPSDPLAFGDWLGAAEPVDTATMGEVRQVIAGLKENQLLKRHNDRDINVTRARLFLERAINVLERSVNPEMKRARPSLDKVRHWERQAKAGPAGLGQLRTELAGMQALAEYIDKADDPASIRLTDDGIITRDQDLREALSSATKDMLEKGNSLKRRQVLEALRGWLESSMTIIQNSINKAG